MQIRWTQLDPVRGISWHFATKFGVGRKLRDTADPLLTLLGAVPDRVAAKQVPAAAGWDPLPGIVAGHRVFRCDDRFSSARPEIRRRPG